MFSKILDFFRRLGYRKGLRDIFETPERRLPAHVAIIMDGNGRWAQERGLPRNLGHQAGLNNLRQVIEGCHELGIKVLTLFAFSTENWDRPADEVNALMTLLSEALADEVNHMHKNNIRVIFIGRLGRFSENLQREFRAGMDLTKENTGMVVNVALNYGGRAELVDAMKSIAGKVQRGELKPYQIDEEVVANHLYTAGLGDPDLLIRTGGESRVSNFLLWQIAYSEFWITPKYWPDFGKKELLEAIQDYSRRERRFGRVV